MESWQPVIFQRRLLMIRDKKTSESNDDESELDTNMVIILAFLLWALILTIGLNAFAGRGIFRSSEAEAEAAPGLNKCALRHLPVAVYDGSGPGDDCPICLGEFMDDERIRVLPECGHAFHVGCIDTWLISHASCPNCRISLLPPPSQP